MHNIYVKTYGCQMNHYDSEKIVSMLSAKGYRVVETCQEADVAVLNTCNIREKAVEKLYSELGRMKKYKCESDLLIVVAGCIAQAQGEEIFHRAPQVDVIVGPQSIHTLPVMLNHVLRTQRKQINIELHAEEKFDFLPQETSQEQSPVSAYLSIQEGCDKFCHFCCVPYTRGIEYSRAPEAIFQEAQSLVSFGAREITVLGQNVNAYHGKDARGRRWDLGELLNYLSEIPALLRLRYVSAHPADMHDSLYESHASNPKVMPFLHLPLQSGSDRILKQMNRKHDMKYYYGIVDRLNAGVPDIRYSSDFIVGYPGETEEDFLSTLQVAKEVGFAQGFCFKYSPRPGTPAALLEKKKGIPEEVKTQRLHHLQAIIDQQRLRFNRSLYGNTVEVLLEKVLVKQKKLVGRTPYMQLVYVEGEDAGLLGQKFPIKIKECHTHSLQGVICS